MINYTIKQGSHYISGIFCHPCEFNAHNPDNAFRWNDRGRAQAIASENNNAVVVEIARTKNPNGYGFSWQEFKA